MNENMIFEGKNERDAIEKAAAELGSESFDVEIIEKTGGLFGFGKVKIRVKALDSIPSHMNHSSDWARNGKQKKIREEKEEEPPRPIDQEHVQKTLSFVEQITQKMGIAASVTLNETNGARVKLEIDTENSDKIIGRKGRLLDSLQILANVYFHNMAEDNNFWRIVLDTQGYRARREENLIRQARRAADHTVRTQKSYLLEPMNPFERHLVHKAISEREEIVTNSEGKGHYKRIRVRLKAAARKKKRR